MAIRTDIYTVDWSASPRIIWIDISVTEGDAQDMYDTIKHYEKLSNGIDEDILGDAGGKEPIGGIVTNTITVSLFNAQYAFADRPGPTWVICNMKGGNVVAFTDETRTVTLYPRKPTEYVSADRTASSSGTLITTGGSALTTDEHNQLMGLPSATDNENAVLDAILASHGNTGSVGKAISDILNAGGALTPTQAQQLEDIFDSTDKKLLTKALWMGLKS